MKDSLVVVHFRRKDVGFHGRPSIGKPPLMAWSMVGDGSIGSPSDHIRSFQLSQSSLSACCSMASALVRIWTDCAARMLVIARALPSPLFKALRRLRRGAWGGASVPSGRPRFQVRIGRASTAD